MLSGVHSREFVDLVKGIGESKSKQEEDELIVREVEVLKKRMASRDVSHAMMKELLIRMIYVEMLGHDASFGHIHAVKMTHGTKMMQKRVGYLAVTLCLHPDHELMLLLVNTLQNDLRSANFMEVAMALQVVTHLVSKDLLVALLPLVAKAIDHANANVRKKAVLALHRFYQINPEVVESHLPKVSKSLCDKDPAVMGATLSFQLTLIKGAPSRYKELIPSFVSILKQITEHRLPREFDYRRMPAPWIQVKLLQGLAMLGRNDKAASEGMYEVLHEVLRRADTGINIGFAILYECVRTITAIYPQSALLEEAARCVARFISSEYHNRKYLGIDALASIVQVNPDYAAEHQLVVIDCLEDDDETLRRKTLDLLFRMTNPHNITVIVDNMMRFLKTSTDNFLRKDLAAKITALAERYAPDNSWFLETMNTVFSLGGKLVEPKVAHSVMRLIAAGTDDDSDEDIRQFAVDTYIGLLDQPGKLPDIMFQVIAWVLGEFGHLSSLLNRAQIIEVLVEMLSGHFDDDRTRCWIISAIVKLVAHSPAGSIPENVLDQFERYRSAASTDLQQRCHEALELCKNRDTMRAVLPMAVPMAEVEVDPLLPMLDAYVATALANGARPYKIPEDEKQDETLDDLDALKASTGLNFKPYSAPDSFGMGSVSIAASNPSPSVPSPSKTTGNTSELRLSGVRRKWGPQGYNQSDDKTSKPPTQPTPQPQPVVQQPVKPRSPSPAPAKAPQTGSAEERAMTEREKRAAMLFSGVSGAANPASSPARPPKRGISRSPPVKPAQKPDNSAVPDLLGLDALGQAAGTAPPSNVNDNPLSTLDEIFGASGLVDLPANEGEGTGSEPAPVSIITDDPFASILASNSEETPGTSSAMDFLASLSPTSAAAAISSKPALDLVSDKVRSSLTALPRSSPADVLLAMDPSLRLSSFTVYAPQHTVVVLFLVNQAGSTLSDLSIQFEPPSNTSIAIEGDPAPQVFNNGSKVKLHPMHPQSVSVIMASLRPRSASDITASLLLTGRVSYTDPVAGRSTHFDWQNAFKVHEFLRPAAITTEQFGAAWQQPICAAAEDKANGVGISASTTLEKALQSLNVHPVAVIGPETIAASSVVSEDGASVVLVHLRSTTNSADCIVRSTQVSLSHLVMQSLRHALTS